MRIILAGVAFATLMTSPLFAQSQSAEGTPRSWVYLEQKTLLRVESPGLPAAAQKPNQPTSNRDLRKEGRPCSTAPGFCQDYHGSNGG
jgi:hypothetical protein